MARTIEVVEHDPDWVAKFEREAESLRAVFGDRAMAIHHIGSTAVPGLDAKPIIDILVVLEDTGSIQSFDPAMEALGYRVRGECLDAPIPGTPGRFYFSKDIAGVRTHHVHACAQGHSEILDKLALAHRHDNIGYMRGKDGFVKAIVADAPRWYQAERKHPW